MNIGWIGGGEWLLSRERTSGVSVAPSRSKAEPGHHKHPWLLLARPNGVSSPSLFLPLSHLLSHFLMWDFCFSFTILVALLLDSGVFCPDTQSQPHFTALFRSFPGIWFSPQALCADFLPSSQENLWLDSCCTTAYIGKPGGWGCAMLPLNLWWDCLEEMPCRWWEE